MKRYGHHKQNHHESGENYQTIYKQYIENKTLVNDLEELSDEDELENNNKKISYIGQLRKHPILL